MPKADIRSGCPKAKSRILIQRVRNNELTSEGGVTAPGGSRVLFIALKLGPEVRKARSLSASSEDREMAEA